MAKSYLPTKIPVNTLSGGVGRQAPNKRLPSEAEELTNVFCTTERSIDKRNGFELSGETPDLIINDGADMWWYWYDAGVERRYLFGIDANNTDGKMLYAWRIDANDNFLEQNTDEELDIHVIRYIQHGGATSQKKLRACAVGSSVLVLNQEVKAGFTSDGTDKLTFDLDGNKIETEDLIGPEVVYRTASAVDPKNEAEVWIEADDFIWGQSTIDTNDSLYSFIESSGVDNLPPEFPSQQRFGIWKVKSDVGDQQLPGPTFSDTARPSANTAKWERVVADETITNTNDWRRYLWSDFIPVEDYAYPDSTQKYLGQSVARFSDLKFPPAATDLSSKVFGPDDIADYGDIADPATVLINLYDTPSGSTQDGQGKIIFLSQAFLSSTPGYYRITSVDKKPYFTKIRTPDKMSVIDNKRMPMQIYLDVENNQWSIRKVDWDPRTSGTAGNNPGPSIFTGPDKKAAQRQIKAISYYRDRLFLASDDVLFSSRIGDFSNFFLDDPANITFRDPIDLTVSSNTYTPITYLKPFKDFLFLATIGNTQYELIGSENQISPLTAELAPTSFFPMTEDIEPLVMNNNLFFFSPKRLYIYFQRFEAAGQQAYELSRHAPDYLPINFWDTAISTSQNMLFTVAGDNPSSEIFCYRNQLSGDKVVQNAFFKMNISSGYIHSINAIDDTLYSVIKDQEYYRVLKLNLVPEEPELPRIDYRKEVSIVSNEYDSESNETIVTFDAGGVVVTSAFNQIVFGSGAYKSFVVDSIEGNEVRVRIPGAFIETGRAWIGREYEAIAEMSTLFLRDRENNIIPGTLNLRYGIARHRFSGQYDVSVSRKQREERLFSFVPYTVDAADTLLDGVIYEKDGTFKFPIAGYADDVIIKIVSSYPTPMNITNLEISGKFKRVSKALTT